MHYLVLIDLIPLSILVALTWRLKFSRRKIVAIAIGSTIWMYASLLLPVLAVIIHWGAFARFWDAVGMEFLLVLRWLPICALILYFSARIILSKFSIQANRSLGVSVALLCAITFTLITYHQTKQMRIPEATNADCRKSLDDYKVFKGSALLQSQGVSVYMAHREANQLLVPKTCDDLNAPFFAVSSSGPIALEGKTSIGMSKIPWGCGTEEPASALKARASISTDSSPFVFHGNAGALKISWKPAKVISTATSCVAANSTHKQDKQIAYSIRGHAQKFLFEAYSKIKEANPDEECDPNQSLYQISLLDGCAEVIKSVQDCDNKGDTDNLVIDGILGVMEIKNNETVEQWLTLITPGYEGEGISVVPIDANGAVDKAKIEFLVYSGC